MLFIAPFVSCFVLASGVVAQNGQGMNMGGGMYAQQSNAGGNAANSAMMASSTGGAMMGGQMQGGQNMQGGQGGQSGGQSGGSPSMMMMPSGTSGAAMPSGSMKVHVIKVSDKNGTLAYSPASTNVPVGEMVQWHFYPKNHSVVQAAFTNPCEPIGNVMPNMTTFFSGYMPVNAADTKMPALTMMVMTAQPFWFYCSQGSHCQNGMVGVINPPKASTGKTIEAFAQKAKTAPPSTIPMMNGATNGTTNDTTSASQTTAGAPAPSTTSFKGAANNFVAMGVTTFIGMAIACLM